MAKPGPETEMELPELGRLESMGVLAGYAGLRGEAEDAGLRGKTEDAGGRGKGWRCRG